MNPKPSPHTENRPPLSTGTIDLTVPQENVVIKEEENHSPGSPNTMVNTSLKESSAEAHQKDEARRNRYLTAYNNLFLIYYNQPPEICSTNIDTALEQCEALIKVAECYGSLFVVRPYLGNIFSQYRHELFLAISKDPPRWLNIATPLQSASIFSEAIIHLAGCWPDWPWPTCHETVDRQNLRLVKTKAKSLADLRSLVDRDILQNTIATNDRPVTLKNSFETWLVVQMFRDWFIEEQNRCRKMGRPHHGAVYRLMRRGGDAYLRTEEVVEMLNGVDGTSTGVWEEVGDDLRLLKDFAQGAVEPLCKNRLMLDVEEAGLQYLTCVEVGMEEFPWMKQAGDDES